MPKARSPNSAREEANAHQNQQNQQQHMEIIGEEVKAEEAAHVEEESDEPSYF